MLTKKQQEKYIRYQYTFEYQALMQCKLNETKTITINNKSRKCSVYKTNKDYEIDTKHMLLAKGTIRQIFENYKVHRLNNPFSCEDDAYGNFICDFICYGNGNVDFLDLACKYTTDEIKQIDRTNCSFPIMYIYCSSDNYAKYKYDGVKVVIIKYKNIVEPDKFLKQLEQDRVELLISDIEDLPKLDTMLLKYICVEPFNLHKVLSICHSKLKLTQVKRAVRH